MKSRVIIIMNCIALLLFVSYTRGWGAQPDAYEDDDNATFARPIVLNDTAFQSHTFHDAGDEDWLKFYGITGEQYQVEFEQLQEDCRPLMEIYDVDGVTVLTSFEMPVAEGIAYPFSPKADGVYYIRIRNYSPAAFGDASGYAVGVGIPIAPGEGTGIISGSISDRDTGAPVENAVVRTSFNVTAISVDGGAYMMLHPSGVFNLMINADGYQQFASSVTVTAGGSVTLNAALVPLGSSTTTTVPCPAGELYGENSEQAQMLRTCRDAVLSKTDAGRAAIALYYTLSAEAARMLQEQPALRAALKKVLDAIFEMIGDAGAFKKSGD